MSTDAAGATPGYTAGEGSDGPTPEPKPLLALPLALVMAVVAGLLAWSAFPPVDFGASAPAAVAVLTAALWGARLRRGFGLGLVFGLSFFLPLLHWMTIVGTDAWLLLSLWCAAWLLIVGAGTALGTRLPFPVLWVTAAWVVSEGLRGRWPWGGFPWGTLGFSQPDTPLAAAAALGGIELVSVAVVVVGASLTAAAVALARAQYRRALAHGVVLAAVMVLPGLLQPLATPGQTDQTTTVAIIQGGTPQMGMGAMDVRRAVLDNHVNQTLDLARAVADGSAPQPQLVVWPESSSDIDPYTDPTVAADITRAAQAIDAPILVGAVVAAGEDQDRVWNVGIVWDPDLGPTDQYVKTHPVPFGEFVPFREQLAPLIGRFDRVPRDFAPGDEPGDLRIADQVVGVVICFEVAYSDVVDAVMLGGASMLVVQTNNATYGGTAQPDQQLDIERMQATATGRTVLVAATSGISAVIDTDRTVRDSMAVGEEGWMIAQVRSVDGVTWGNRLGVIIEAALFLVFIVGIAWTAVRARRARRAVAAQD